MIPNNDIYRNKFYGKISQSAKMWRLKVVLRYFFTEESQTEINMWISNILDSLYLRIFKYKTCVCETRMPPAATKSKYGKNL